MTKKKNYRKRNNFKPNANIKRHDYFIAANFTNEYNKIIS